VADGHRTFAEVLAARLGEEPRVSAADVAVHPQDARALLALRRYDVLVLDPGADVRTWSTVLRLLDRALPSPAVVVISDEDDAAQVVDVLTVHEVRAWISKDTSYGEFLHVIDEAVAGRTWFAPAVLGPVLHELLARTARSAPEPTFIDDLTSRQREVLRCLADGLSRSEVAAELGLSPHTVRTHVQEVLRKAGVHSTLAAVARAREVGYRGLPTRDAQKCVVALVPRGEAGSGHPRQPDTPDPPDQTTPLGIALARSTR
jgi:DNA-binding NarL/FixJ family response regulator